MTIPKFTQHLKCLQQEINKGKDFDCITKHHIEIDASEIIFVILLIIKTKTELAVRRDATTIITTVSVKILLNMGYSAEC